VREQLHLIRNTFRLTSRKYWDELKRDLKPIYTAVNAAAARAGFDELAAKWGARYPAVVRLWDNAWAEFIPFLDYDVEIRRVLCSTDEIVNCSAAFRCSASSFRPAAAALDRRPAAVVKVERPAGRTTLTAARTAVASGGGGRG
jgi:transposase-like protein